MTREGTLLLEKEVQIQEKELLLSEKLRRILVRGGSNEEQCVNTVCTRVDNYSHIQGR